MDWSTIMVAVIAAIPGTLVGWAALRQGKMALSISQKTEHSVNSKMDLIIELKDKISDAAEVAAYVRGLAERPKRRKKADVGSS